MEFIYLNGMEWKAVTCCRVIDLASLSMRLVVMESFCENASTVRTPPNDRDAIR